MKVRDKYNHVIYKVISRAVGSSKDANGHVEVRVISLPCYKTPKSYVTFDNQRIQTCGHHNKMLVADTICITTRIPYLSFFTFCEVCDLDKAKDIVLEKLRDAINAIVIEVEYHRNARLFAIEKHNIYLTTFDTRGLADLDEELAQ